MSSSRTKWLVKGAVAITMIVAVGSCSSTTGTSPDVPTSGDCELQSQQTEETDPGGPCSFGLSQHQADLACAQAADVLVGAGLTDLLTTYASHGLRQTSGDGKESTNSIVGGAPAATEEPLPVQQLVRWFECNFSPTDDLADWTYRMRLTQGADELCEANDNAIPNEELGVSGHNSPNPLPALRTPVKASWFDDWTTERFEAAVAYGDGLCLVLFSVGYDGSTVLTGTQLSGVFDQLLALDPIRDAVQFQGSIPAEGGTIPPLNSADSARATADAFIDALVFDSDPERAFALFHPDARSSVSIDDLRSDSSRLHSFFPDPFTFESSIPTTSGEIIRYRAVGSDGEYFLDVYISASFVWCWESHRVEIPAGECGAAAN